MQLFIADLHLSPEHPRLVRGFLDLLQHYQGKIEKLYILGDWFEAWIGDDDDSPWLDEIVSALQQFSAHGTQVLFQRGNRDFALGQRFLKRFGGVLLPDEFDIQSNQLSIHIEHGDALCTDDVDYQKFRQIIRNPLVLGFLKMLPLGFRRKLANTARAKSKQANASKQSYIMDVNEAAVQQALARHHILLHGHTHRPQVHHYADGKQRIVLGDWRENSAEKPATYCGEAMIAELDDTGLHLLQWFF